MNHSDFQTIEQKLLKLCQPLPRHGNDPDPILNALKLAWPYTEKHLLPVEPEAFDNQLSVIEVVIKDLRLGVPSVVSVLLRWAYYNDYISEKEVATHFGRETLTILEGLCKVSDIVIQNITAKKIEDPDKVERTLKLKKEKEKERIRLSMQTENYINLLLTLAEDPRSILIELAFKLHSLRIARNADEASREKIATEASVLFAPVAHRLGLYIVKTEMEELSMKLLKPAMYQHIKLKLNESRESREAFIHGFIEPLKKELKKRQITCEIKGRPKSIYSIWRKMEKQQTPFEGVYDLFAIRIILTGDFANRDQEKAQCWEVYSLISDWYEPNPYRLRDWISFPKSNGYESLHTTVAVPHAQHKWVEVQIRTRRMDEVAERGDAAHWKYKESATGSDTDNWLKGLRAKIETPGDEKMDSDAKNELYSDRIFVFTPKGDLKKIKYGATLLDFAYLVHSDLGDKCVGGVVNSQHKPLKYVVQNGDTVKILTSKNQMPSPDWLNIAQTSRAIKKIGRVLKDAEYADAAAGKDMLMYKFNQLKVSFVDTHINRVRDYFDFKQTLDMYQAIGEGKIDLSLVKRVLSEEEKPQQKKAEEIGDKGFEQKASTPSDDKDDFLMIGDNLKDLGYKLSPCCNPIFGDNVFGFVTISEGIKIHRVNCPNAAQMLSRYPHRMVKAKWRHADDNYRFPASLKISGSDSVATVSYITEAIKKDPNIQLRSIKADAKDGVFEGEVALFVKDIEVLKSAIRKIKGIKGVYKVERMG